MNQIIIFISPFLFTVLLMPIFIDKLKSFSFGQQIRKEGPESHYSKEGIPTMGGALILAIVLISIFIFLDLSIEIVLVLLVIITSGLLGFIDDILNIKGAESLGLTAKTKFLIQLIIGLIIGVLLFYYNITDLYIPFTANSLNLGYLVIPFSLLLIPATSNAVNLSDGLDGLAGSLFTISCLAFIPILYILGFNQIILLLVITISSCLGFLWYNANPAQIFMGDTGSLFLGSFLAIIALLTGTSLYLLFLGGIFVIVTLSVILQVSYFKISGGKRIFKMAPIHHHFELSGWPEVKVTMRFIILQILFSGVGIIASLPLI
ncbi:phospho-N-acetylmuramoyl-pentapeptide-transferase [Halanaerobiaceae bacterium Z-7014]|uniref:Phospho-N-acetylmuramoyl-pentapeptide-transferase n=1 Tax=Halonatronomonas betaini TaxID=2778430 RepID=A0A931AVR1_9FIRM|nr:phospho-N-acetylmuramoyl-pentapeptide-transferase [Halonatronomonas betaini]MBF8437640.1 phospho-N-acetylmuramoyl-pentapeptide-transferase [Halonatronomonas betaini]